MKVQKFIVEVYRPDHEPNLTTDELELILEKEIDEGWEFLVKEQ